MTEFVALALGFGGLSLLAFGGASALTPEIHRLVIEQHGWMNDQVFVELFAIGQAAPGPNVLLVSLIGWWVAGVPGALLSTLAITLPGSVLTFHVSGWWERFRDHPLRQRIQQSILPLTVRLVACTAFVLIHLADHSGVAVFLTLTSALVAFRTRLNPLWLLGAGALLGLAGFV